MNPSLHTERLLLRDAAPGDLDLLVRLDADEGVKRYIDGGAAVDIEEVRERLEWWLGYHERSPGYGFWLAFGRDGGEFLGWFHLRPGEDRADDEPELGYRLHRATWGQGVASEASARLVDHAFADQQARLVYATTMAVNAASRRVMEKVGMRLVRTFHADWPVRIPGDEHGDVEYAITREEWEARPRERAPLS
jgi:RimJ/RimL family protein N-acetyltransferase